MRRKKGGDPNQSQRRKKPARQLNKDHLFFCEDFLSLVFFSLEVG